MMERVYLYTELKGWNIDYWPSNGRFWIQKDQQQLSKYEIL